MLKVAIIGKLPSKFKAPFGDTDWEIWGCNVHKDFEQIPRYDKWFDIHTKPANYPLIPKEKLYLRDEVFILKMNKLLEGDYITNSMVYLVLYAIYLGAKEIALYGCRLDSVEEDRTKQLQNLREILFYAKGKGIEVFSWEDNILADYEMYR